MEETSFDLLDFICGEHQQQQDCSDQNVPLPVLDEDILAEVVNIVTADDNDEASLGVAEGQQQERSLWSEVVNEGSEPETALNVDFDVDILSPGNSSSNGCCGGGSSTGGSSDPSEVCNSDAEGVGGVGRCPVCGRSDVGKHVYYGARVCISCRGFFRRSVQNNHYPLFQCQYASNCKVDSTNRRSCKSCRFQKCLAAGMKVSWVMTDSERKTRILAKKSKGEVASPGGDSIAKSPETRVALRRDGFTHTMTVEEQQQVGATFQVYLRYAFDKYYSAMAADRSFLPSFMSMMLTKRPLDLEFLLRCEDLDLKAVVEYGFDLPEVRSLPAFDRMNLMFTNHKLIYGLLSVSFLRVEDIQDCFSSFLDYGRERRSLDPTVDGLVGEMERLSVDLSGSSDPAVHEGMADNYLESATKILTEQERLQLFALFDKLNRVLRTDAGTLDNFLLVLAMRMLLLRDPGADVRLEDPAKVRGLHEAQAWQLHRYLKTFYGSDANRRFHQLLMLEDSLKFVYDLAKRANVITS